MKKKVLFVCVVTPFRFGGGAQATTAYLDATLDIFGHQNVDVIVDDEIKVPQGYEDVNFIKVSKRGKLSSLLGILNGQLGRFAKPALRELLTGKYEICIFNGGRQSGWVLNNFKNKSVKFVTIHHNLETEYCMDTKHIATFGGRYDGIVKKQEQFAYRKSDLNLFLTKQDQEAFEKIYGRTDATNVVVGTYDFKNAEKIQLHEQTAKEYDIVISGSLKTYQTEHGIKNFMDNYFDIILKYIPDVRILMTGRDPSQGILAYAERYANHIRIIPSPQDIHAEVRKAKIFLCPTDIGGGLKLRAMDGLKNGLPILVHTVSSRGYDAYFDKPYFNIYNDKVSFKKGLIQTLDYLKENELDIMNINYDYYQYFGYESGKLRFCNALSLII